MLALLPGIHLAQAPRTVRLCRVAVACEQALGWPSGAALAALGASADEAASAALEGSLIPALLEKLLAAHPDGWDGEPTALYDALSARLDEPTRNSRRWPQEVATFGKQLDRLTGPLSRWGIEVTRPARGRRRCICVARTDGGV